MPIKNAIKARKFRAKAVAKGAREVLRLPPPKRKSVTRRVAEAVRRAVKRHGASAMPTTTESVKIIKRAVQKDRRKIRMVCKKRRGWM
jgi:hypothetical protein